MIKIRIPALQDKILLSTVVSVLITVFSSSEVNGQSLKKLKKIYTKRQPEKLIKLSQKGLDKNPHTTAYQYYLIAGYLLQAESPRNTRPEQSYFEATKIFVANRDELEAELSQKIVLVFRSQSRQIFDALGQSEFEKRNYYSRFFAEYLSDTTDYFRNGLSGSAFEIEKINIKSISGIEYHIPAVIPPSESIIKYSEEAIGTPWVYAGMEPGKGFDCSGFVIWAYGKFGYNLPHKTKLLASIGKNVDTNDIAPGDIVCFGNSEYQPSSVYHVGMIHSVEEDVINMIHCGTSTGVIIAPLNIGYWSTVEHFFVRIGE